jgi:hypothetical protein
MTAVPAKMQPRRSPMDLEANGATAGAEAVDRKAGSCC